MDLGEMAQQVKSKEDFVNFLQVLINDFETNNEEWENPELGRYLEAMERFLEGSSDKSINKIDFTPSWSLFARLMVVAIVYE